MTVPNSGTVGAVGPVGAPRSARSARPLTVTLAFVADALLVILFAALGRGSHARDATLLGLFETAWPFLAGLAIAWLVVCAWRRPAALLRTGIPVWLGAAVLGLVLRWITGGGMAPAFMIVTVLTIGLFLMGWRAIAALVLRLRRPRSA